MKETDKAYIAGIVDGEGYIGIKKITTRRNGRVNPAYQEKIQIKMIDEEAIKFISDSLGGNYYQEKRFSKNRRPIFAFQASDRQAVNMLKTILPYLRVKKEVAKTVIDFRKLKDSPEKESHKIMMKDRWGNNTEFTRWRHSKNHIAKCEKFHQRCKTLNTVGYNGIDRTLKG